MRDGRFHLAIPSYKDATSDHGTGFEAEFEHMPKPKGAWWLRFFYVDGEGVKFDYMRAK